jgi:cytochrome c-type biogenesis protein CcmH/NrfF
VAARRRRRVAGLWAAVALAAGLALAIGAGAFSSGGKPVSLYQRTLAVAGQYRCPVCASESAAVSDAAEAVEMRSLIQGWLKQGDSQTQIRHFLVTDYGPSILEKPPATGLNSLVWALPAAAGALGVAGLGFAFARWRRQSARDAGPVVSATVGPGLSLAGIPPASSSSSGTPASVPVQDRLFDPGAEQEPAGLPELGLLEPGLLEPGLLAPGLAVAGRTGASRPAPVRPMYRRVAPILGTVLIVVAGALWLIDRSTQRLPGSTATGGISGVDEELQQAASLASSNPAAALALYDAVLTHDPDQAVALSGEGWIYAEAGYAAKAEDLLQKAETDDPSYDAPHLYRGLVLLEDQRRPAAAIRELKWYLAHGPDPTLAKTAKTALAQAEDNL